MATEQAQQLLDEPHTPRPNLAVVPDWRDPDDQRPPERASMHQLEAKRRELTSKAEAGNARGQERQRQLGKLTARERIAALVDPDSFAEIGLFVRGEGGGHHTDGVICGHGRIHGHKVFVFAQDFAIAGGSLGVAHLGKIRRVLDMAVRAGAPLIGIFDGGGARIQEGAAALDACASLFWGQINASGVIPQISVIVGPCAGAAAYAPALSDVIFMVEGVGQMYLTGPDVVKAVTGEDVSAETLGGAGVHGRESGVATFIHPDEMSCLEDARYLVSMLPEHPGETPEHKETDDPVGRDCSSLLDLVPADPRRPYDMLEVIHTVVDEDTFLEFHEMWATNIICGLGRINGKVVGIVANQPQVLAGALTLSAAEKAARFVRFCDAFHMPLLTLVDVPGFMPGSDQERLGVIRHGAKLLYAYGEATTPRVQLIVRKAYGGAYIAMDCRALGADLSLAWPSNQIAVMGAEGAVDVIHRRELGASEDPAPLRQRLCQAYEEEHMHSLVGVEKGVVDALVDPAETRAAISQAFDSLERAPRRPARRHGNPPL